MLKKKTASFVKSKFFKIASVALGIVFIVLTFFISITPDSFLQYGYAGVFLFNVISSGLLIMPVLAKKLNIFLVVLVSALGNIPNTSVNYLIGNTSNHLFSKNPIIILLKKWMEKFGLLVVYILAIIPLPLDVNGLLSGYVGIPFGRYILVNFLGKVTIFSLVFYGIIAVSQAIEK